MRSFQYIVPSAKPKTNDIRRMEALLRRFWSRPACIQKISLHFGNNVIRQPVRWTMGLFAPRLLSSCCGNSQTALFVVENGLFTCKARSLLSRSPYTPVQYVNMEMHDGSHQWVPAIRSLHTLDITYPVSTALSPQPPWTMFVVNVEDRRLLPSSLRNNDLRP